MEQKFPTFQKSIEDLIKDEEGNIPRSKIVMIGSTIMLTLSRKVCKFF